MLVLREGVGVVTVEAYSGQYASGAIGAWLRCSHSSRVTYLGGVCGSFVR